MRRARHFTIPKPPGKVAVRTYLITVEQFVDVLAQETRRSPGMALDLAPAFSGQRYSNGVGGYPILVRLGAHCGVPLVTFTRDWRSPPTLGGADHALPSGHGNWPARGAPVVMEADRSLSIGATRRARS